MADETRFTEPIRDARYGEVRREGRRILIERTDIEVDATSGKAAQVTEWVPFAWALAHLPREQEQALRAAEAGFEAERCPHSADEPCDECLDRQLRELVTAYRKAVPWWDDSDRAVDSRLRQR